MTTVTKRTRTRLAKAELWLQLATTAENWAGYCALGLDGDPPDDPLVRLARTYDLTAADLGRLLSRMGAELETRALRAGYDETWDDPRA